MIHYVCLGIHFTELKGGLHATQYEAELFFNRAYDDAQFSEVSLYLNGIDNSCDHRFVNFDSLNKIENNFFTGNKIHLYIGSVSELSKYKNSFKNCDIEVYFPKSISDSIAPCYEILSDNNNVVISSISPIANSSFEKKKYYYDYSQIHSLYKQIRDSEVSLDYRKNILFIVDETCSFQSLRIVKQIQKNHSEIIIDVLDLSKGSHLLDSCPKNSQTIVTKGKTIKSSGFGNILERQKLVVYLGTSHLYNLAFFKPVELAGVPFVASSLSANSIGTRPTFCILIIYNKTKNTYDAEYIYSLYESLLYSDSPVKNSWINHLESYNHEQSHQLSEMTKVSSEASDLTNFFDGVSNVFETSKSDDVFVLWLGRFDFIGGYGAVARGYMDAMEAVGIRSLCVDINSLKPVGKATGGFWVHDKNSNRYILPPNTIVVINDLPTKYGQFKGVNFSAKIGCTLFETDSFPVDWIEGFDFVDEVWVPTKFNFETFNFGGISKDKMSIIGYSVDTSFYQPFEKVANHKEDTINFLYILSNLNRKDPGLLLRSYFRAFQKTDKVCLTIKTRMPENRFYAQMKAHLPSAFFDNPDLPEVKIISETLSDDAMRNLYRDTDIYVTTERAKGWDYPAMEAMCMGIPTVGLDWSGSEFLSHKNAYLIPVKDNLIRVHSSQVDNAEMYFGHKWADVDEYKVQEALILAYNDDKTRASKSQQCIKDSKMFSANVVGACIKERLKHYLVKDVKAEPAVLYY